VSSIFAASRHKPLMMANDSAFPRTVWVVIGLFLLIALVVWWWFDHRIGIIDATIDTIQTQ
jgi:hypothetical protein